MRAPTARVPGPPPSINTWPRGLSGGSVALLTWLAGAAALEIAGFGFMDSFMLQPGVTVIGVGAWLGTIMLFNVWVLIWPNQKKILGLVEATDEEKAKAKTVALMASRTNTFLSIPMLMCMVGQMHGFPL